MGYCAIFGGSTSKQWVEDAMALIKISETINESEVAIKHKFVQTMRQFFYVSDGYNLRRLNMLIAQMNDD